MLADQLTIEHNVLVELIGPNGEIKERREVHNLVPTVGKNAYADQVLAEPTKAKPSHMAIGTGETEAKAADTKLIAEVDRNALASKTREANVLTMKGEWAPGDGTGAITEAGVFNSSEKDKGDLYNRAVFPVINKGALDELRITWTVTYG